MKMSWPYDDGRVALLEDDDGKRYAIPADLTWVSTHADRSGFTRVSETVCKCCGTSTHSPVAGEEVFSLEQLIAKGWAMTEEAYLEWKRGGER